MANKKTQIAAGLAGLMAQPAQLEGLKISAPQDPTAHRAAAPKNKGNYKTVGYSLDPELAELMKAQAKKERRTIGATVSQAFREYLKKHSKK